MAGADYEPGTFWEGKQGAAIPPGKEAGWMIPDELRPRWQLVLGRSQEELPPLLDRLGAIDLFVHDSEHSYECMHFEFQTAGRRCARAACSWPTTTTGTTRSGSSCASRAARP